MKNRKHTFVLLLLVFYVSWLLSGCTININVSNPSKDATNETLSSENSDINSNLSIYQSRATIYISNKTTTEAPGLSISSSDLSSSISLMETYAAIFSSRRIQDKIREAYPEVEYTLTLEPIDETEVCAIIAVGEDPEYLQEICNLAVSLLCEEVPELIEGSSCKVVDFAKPAQLIGTDSP